MDFHFHFYIVMILGRKYFIEQLLSFHEYKSRKYRWSSMRIQMRLYKDFGPIVHQKILECFSRQTSL